MLDKRLFSKNALTGMTEWFVFDDETGKVTMTAEQEVGDMVESNKREQNEVFREGHKWGEFARVATIPMALYSQWLLERRDRDHAWIRKWLNERDNQLFRTRLGRV